MQVSQIKLYLIKHWPKAIGFLLAGTMIFWAYGCEPETESLLNPGTKVTAAELQAELDYYMTITKERFTDLQQQKDFRKMIFEQAAILSASGTVNPLGLITSLGSIFGLTAAANNVKLRRELKKNKPETG